VGHQFDNLAACKEMKSQYEHANGGTPELLARSGIKYVCMEKLIPNWRPAE
jgi:hypothetical protein